MERYFEISEQTPFTDKIEDFYLAHNERIQLSNYKRDLEIADVFGVRWSERIHYEWIRNMLKTEKI